jgi:hypothetical protein
MKSVFVLVFVVEVVVGYNPFMYKTQLQKLIFFIFCSFFSGSHTQPQPPPQIQTHLTQKKNKLPPIQTLSKRILRVRYNYFLKYILFINKLK